MSELSELAPGSVPRLLIGQRLRQLRTRKGIHTELAAAEAGVARATLWRFEKGDNRCRYKIGDVERLGRIYGADPDTTLSLVALARATKGRTWTAAYRDLLTHSASARSANRSDARRHLQIRINRQQVLGREPATTMFEFVLDEAALHRGVGEPATMMIAQLHRLVELDAVDEVKLYEQRWNDIAGRALDELSSRNLILDAANRFKP